MPRYSFRSLQITHLRRIMTPFALAFLLVSSLTIGFTVKTAHASGFIGPKHYYMAIGNSISFGYQPDLNWADGYTTDWANQMQQRDSGLEYDNLACPGETTTTFLNGGCPYWYIRKYFYTGSQMSAALTYLSQHAGQVSPVSLDIGANDLLPCYSNGSINTSCGNSALNTVRTNLPIIVSKIKNALHGTGDFFLMNYYDPYQNAAPSTLTWVNQLNSIIAQVGQQYGVPVVDVASIYHTSSYPNGGNPAICNWTWYCSIFSDIHPNSNGYTAIAGGFESLSGY
jgi:lysophospholipase L1-like esterase